ncbi:miniconductance mechanosensitive channel MscM [Aeromonas schubertii]|uniref:Miniconductance mechanosensitive channel MscM n=1 Tax=Aeromonas schubertii TaxID=652 RepID=A0ABS7V933_9GAMM|nr:miniconductance mechanosensitive channel MscM [Aeromonas schubertii]MBZ6065466.1 miniconductance mechanosensitive channel MscM [Aeromonas schubertii]
MRRLLLLLALFLAPLVHGEEQLIQIEQQLAAIPSADTPENQKLREPLQQALQAAREASHYRELAEKYQTELINYHQTSSQLKAQVQGWQPPRRLPTEQLNDSNLGLEMSKTARRQLELRRQRQGLLDELSQIESGGLDYHQRVDALRRQLIQVRQQADKLQLGGESGRLAEANRLLLQVREQSLGERIAMLELDQLSAPQRIDLAKLRLQEVNLAITDEDEWQSTLVSRQDQLRREKSERILAESERLRKQLKGDQPLLQEQQQYNSSLSLQLETIEESIDRVRQEQSRVDKRLQELSELGSALREQMEWLQVSDAYGEDLRGKLSELPAPYPLPKLESLIVKTRVAKRQYDNELAELGDLAQARSRVEQGETLDRPQQLVLDSLLKARRQLLTRLLDASDSLLQDQTRLKLLYSRQNSKIAEIRDQGSNHLFWLPDTRPVSGELLLDTPAALGLALKPGQWRQLIEALQVPPLSTRVTVFSALLILAYLWWRLGRDLLRVNQAIAPRIGKVTQDKFSLSSRLLLRALLASLPLPAMVFLLRYLYQGAWEYPFANAVISSLGELWFLLFALLFTRHLCLERGLLALHFGWQPDRVARIWGHFRVLMLILIPSFFIQGIGDAYQGHALYDTLGRLAFIIGSLWLLLFFYRLNRERLPLTWGQSDMSKPHLLHHFVWNSLMLAPLLAVGGALFGYFFTARTLLRQLEVSLLCALLFMLIYYLARRWMLIQRRRLQFERAKARRAEILAQREQEEGLLESSEPNEEMELDLDTLSAHSLRLIRTLLMLGYTALLMFLWSDLMGAFSFLGNIELWQVSSTVGGIAQLEGVTIKDLALTLFVLIITVVTARNLHSLLELSLLQHLNLTPGTGFAITTMAKYMVIVVGALSCFSLLGIDWSKTQWLVAALSVGLGFGLQEIFANFVSGLIILFEKPIRIGDTVTIRDLTGTVSRIKTRATTIVDWDRKEIIMPNKAFITEQFINWSLSDAITRVKIRIRIALHADPVQIQRLLEESILQCSLVLDTPTPEAFLVELTDSALIYELRVYVNNMDHRMPITHELHNRVLGRLKELGLALPHQQIDIRLSRA